MPHFCTYVCAFGTHFFSQYAAEWSAYEYPHFAHWQTFNAAFE